MGVPRRQREIRASCGRTIGRPMAATLVGLWLAILTVAALAASDQVSGGPAGAGYASGNHPLTEAIIAGDVALVKKLLGEGLDPNKSYDFEHPRWNMGEKTKKHLSPTAGMFGRLEILKLIHGHPKFKSSMYVNTEALCMAIAHRHSGAALFLIAKGAVVNPPGGCLGYWTPLARAKDMALDEVVAALLKAGAR